MCMGQYRSLWDEEMGGETMSAIPFVIDNQQHRMGDVLNTMLAQYNGQSLDIMISTDVLSEGQNLQDCGVLINYDLHWNPTRMVQRAGRIDRIGTSFETLWVLNMFPDEGLEKLLGLVESLSQKIASIDQSGFLDASILGEVVHPRNFNT